MCRGRLKTTNNIFDLILPKPFLSPAFALMAHFLSVIACLCVKLCFPCVCVAVCTEDNSPVGKHGTIWTFFSPLPLFRDTGNVWVKKQPSKVNSTAVEGKKKRPCQHNLRAGKTITTSASVYINPADAKQFPIFAWLAFYFNAWGNCGGHFACGWFLMLTFKSV